LGFHESAGSVSPGSRVNFAGKIRIGTALAGLFLATTRFILLKSSRMWQKLLKNQLTSKQIMETG